MIDFIVSNRGFKLNYLVQYAHIYYTMLSCVTLGKLGANPGIEGGLKDTIYAICMRFARAKITLGYSHLVGVFHDRSVVDNQ